MRTLLNWLRLVIARRIAIDANSHSLVLDAGCGDKPHWRADVLVDQFLDESHAAQRNTGGAVRPVAPLFEAPLEKLPFADKAFDYVYCSHVLEHVRDPVAALRELVRVGVAGYIEVPFVGVQKIFDQETHLWFCDLEAPRALLFRAKERFDFDDDIRRFLSRGPIGAISFALNFFPDATMIRLKWSNDAPITARSIGQPNDVLAQPSGNVSQSGPHHNHWAFIRKILRRLHAKKLRRDPISYNSIIRPEYRLHDDEFLSPKVYRVSDSAPKVDGGKPKRSA